MLTVEARGSVEKLGYTPALDGVRAVAIALVVGFHYFDNPRGGIIGVDLFFVLSGFLITTLLLEEHLERGKVSIRAFYVRRARRLLPALAMLLAVYATIVVAMGHDPLREIALGGLYVGNAVQAFGVAPWLRHSALGHLWSLAQEEQFYLVWPAVLLILVRRPRRAPAILAVAFAAVCLYRAGLALDGAGTSRILFGPDTRADGLLLGSLLAFLRLDHGRRVGEWAGKAGVTVLFLSAFAASPTVAWTAYGLPVFDIGAALLIAAAVADTAVARGLSSRPLVWLGKRSYSLYLWHFPILVAVPGVRWSLLTLPAAVIAATASYRFVEQPFRRRRSKTGERRAPKPSPHPELPAADPQP